MLNTVLINMCSHQCCAAGIHFGPLLRLAHMNDIHSACRGNTIRQLLADDTRLCSWINVLNDSLTLQQSLDGLINCANKRQQSTDINKCALLSLSGKPQLILQAYCINGLAILVKTVMLTCSSDFSFRRYINNVVFNAQQPVFSFVVFHLAISALCNLPLSLISVLFWNTASPYGILTSFKILLIWLKMFS